MFFDDPEFEDLIAYDMLFDIGLGFYDHSGDEEDCEQCGYEADNNEDDW